jgi:hypothetical protein
MIDATTLQSVDQNQIDSHICTKNDNQKDEDKHKDKLCICDQIHLFSQCSYIVSVNKTSEWKENFKMRNETRQKIQTKSFMIYSIKRIADINILNELISSSKRKKRDEDEKNDDDFYFNFANSAFANSTLMIIYHSLMNSVIYDSSCNQSLIFDKIRFLNDLISSNDQIKISDDQMQIEKYEIMLIWKQLKDKKIEMTFKKTAYISICFVTLVSQSKLEKEKFDRDSFIKTLIHLKTNKQICEIQKRFEMQLLEYNLISRDDQMMTNSIQLSKNIMIKTISWQWHQRFEHCRSQMIDHLSKEWVSNNDDSASKTIKCEICVVFKMHRLVQKTSTARITKSYEMLHFDLIIYEIKEFDDTICIAHFTKEFTYYSWVFSLTNHRKKTLMFVFKSLINRCDRSNIAINSMIRIIRTNQETSINKRLENWIINQRIIWNWSAKNIFEQNDKSKRYKALLIEKARCIREHAKLSKNLFLECYMIAEHLMNRIFNQILNWDSSLIRLNKLINSINQNQSIRPELNHLKMYECKTYSLLKKADASSRDNKLKSRAFVDYLVDYNSTNIFKIWNPEKEDVNEYRDVIFDEDKLYDIYNKSDSLITLEKKSQIELQNRRTMKISINQLIDLNNENDEWLEISIRNRLMLKNKRVVELSTSSSKELSQKKSSQKRSSRSFTLVSSQSLADSFIEIDYSSLSKSSSLESKIDSKRNSSLTNLTDRILDMRRKREIKKNVISIDLDETNILKEKRIRFVNNKYSKFDYAQLTWIEEKWDKILEFHVVFMTELIKLNENQIEVQIDLKNETSISANRIHISTLLSSSAHWRAMLKHSHEDEFRKVAQLEFDVIESRDTWKIMNKSIVNQKIISLKWMFIYKNDSNDYLTKYKARIMMRDDLQDADSQNVYAVTLTSKIFRVLMTLVIAFRLKTRQLNVVNAFFNAHNDESVYCQMSDDYRLDDKCYRIIKALYD